MRLTLVIDGLGAGGAQRVLVGMANYWAAKGWPVTLVTLAGADERPAFELDRAVTLTSLGTARAERNPWRRLVRKTRHVGALRSAIEASRPDAVISFLEKMNVLTLLALRNSKVPVVVSERTDPAVYDVGLAWRLLRSRTYPAAAALVAQSTAALEYFPHLPRRLERVIPNPVLSPGGEPGARAGDAPPVVLGLGRLSREKGFDRLLEAFARVASRFPQWRLEVWGEGPERASLEKRREELGLAQRVLFPGVTSDPIAVLRAADVFVLPSRFEGFPNALCEAMACGLPVISFDCPSGPREIVRHKVDGLLVQPEADVGGLAHALEKLLGDPAERARLAARAPEVRERYGLDKVMWMWEKLLDDVLARRAAA